LIYNELIEFYLVMQMLSVGSRIKTLRTMLGMSRENFCQRHDINFNTLTSIELDRMKVSVKQLNNFIRAFAKEGICIQECWLKEGSGTPPEKSTQSIQLDKKETHSFLQQWAKFFDQHQDSVVLQIKDPFMEPFYWEGDFVGGVWSSTPYLLLGKRCLAQVDEKFHVGTLHYTEDNFILAPSNSNDIAVLTNSPPVAEILWHVRYHDFDQYRKWLWQPLSYSA
jgi:transcriptional regulator with XRE-family HTH domain